MRTRSKLALLVALAAGLFACAGGPAPRGLGHAAGFHGSLPGLSTASPLPQRCESDDALALWTVERARNPAAYAPGVQALGFRAFRDLDLEELEGPPHRRGFAIAILRSDRGRLFKFRFRWLPYGAGAGIEIVDLMVARGDRFEPVQRARAGLALMHELDLDTSLDEAPVAPAIAADDVAVRGFDLRQTRNVGAPQLEPSEPAQLFVPLGLPCVR